MKIILILLILVQFSVAQQKKPVLLRQSIQKAIKTENLKNFESICKRKVSIHFEEPFSLNGYFYRNNFVDVFFKKFYQYQVRNLEWSTKQIEENFAIQSLNLVLKHKKSEIVIYYKFIFFMTRDEVEMVKFDGFKSNILFKNDPDWGTNSEFEITGTVDGKNDGWYRIIGKKGHLYTVKKLTGPIAKEISQGAGGRAKAWKLYYLRGLKI
jgi:hypothetical protein